MVLNGGFQNWLLLVQAQETDSAEETTTTK
jgi:hypothetical protein